MGQQTAGYLPHAESAPPSGSMAGPLALAARPPSAFLTGLFVVLALASAIQAILYPELLGDIFARL